MAGAVAAGSAFPKALRAWRASRKLSQRELAQQTNLSQKHLSLLEVGSASPSEDVILRLGLALRLSPHDRNLLLQSGGFAHAYRRAASGDPRMSAAIKALRPLLSGLHCPAVAVDGAWNILAINARMGELMRGLGLDQASLSNRAPPAIAKNLMKLLLHPNGMRPTIVNWECIAMQMIGHLCRQAALTERADLQQLLNEVGAYPDVPGAPIDEWPMGNLGPLTELQFRLGSAQASFSALCSTLGTPFDITTDEIRSIQFVPREQPKPGATWK
ncbi:MAG: helix-turn-helix transcriptional regulator [Sulfuritalea sp.]|nr:helix-turn-helix transcriptional regulator [Sulfuritalea sp.]